MVTNILIGPEVTGTAALDPALEATLAPLHRAPHRRSRPASSSPGAAAPALVVIDPIDPRVVHANGGCPELTFIDLVERAWGAPVDDPDAFDAAVADLGFALPATAAAGLRHCSSCWRF